MQLTFPTIDPAAQIRDYRNNYVNISSLVKQSKDAPTNLSLMSPDQQPIQNLDLPAALRQGMADFQAGNPDGRPLTPVKYMKIVNGSPEVIIEDDNPLPAEEDLVTFSYTLTAVSLKSASIVTHQLVATLASDKAGAIA
jgi:hypothetical protein